MAAPKPITLVSGDADDFQADAQPFAVIGSVPVAASDVKTLTAVPASFADLAAVRTYLNTLVTELKSSIYFS
jgi:hypothetical protein